MTVLNELVDMVRRAGRVYLCGNGGSAANAIHIANDLISVRVPAQALTADVATLTAIANDFGYDQVFDRQLTLFGKKGDLLIVLSGSGKSKNVVNAARTAKAIGMTVYSLVGDFSYCYPVSKHSDGCHYAGRDMQLAEEAQLEIGHAIMKVIKGEMK